MLRTVVAPKCPGLRASGEAPRDGREPPGKRGASRGSSRRVNPPASPGSPAAATIMAGRKSAFGGRRKLRESGCLRTIGRRSALGARRSALGARRSALGARRSALGARRSALGARRSALGARRSALGARRSALGARRSALGARRSALGARRSALGARRSALGARRSALGARRSALGARRSALGARRSIIRANNPGGVNAIVQITPCDPQALVASQGESTTWQAVECQPAIRRLSRQLPCSSSYWRNEHGVNHDRNEAGARDASVIPCRPWLPRAVRARFGR